MSRLSKHEMLAKNLIEGRVEEELRERLKEEHRIEKNQFYYHLIPLKSIQSLVSWNSLLLLKLNSQSSLSDDTDKTSNRRARKKDFAQFPQIVNGRERERDSASSSNDTKREKRGKQITTKKLRIMNA